MIVRGNLIDFHAKKFRYGGRYAFSDFHAFFRKAPLRTVSFDARVRNSMTPSLIHRVQTTQPKVNKKQAPHLTRIK